MVKSGLVSVIMAAYNEELRWVKESIESILHQSYKNFEFLIVLDNPEYKELRELLLDYSNRDNRIRLIINEENLGESKSFNRAFSLCIGEYLMIMHADDVAGKERIEIQKEYLDQNNLDFVVSSLTFIDENGHIVCESDDIGITNELFKKLIGEGFCIAPSGWFMRPEIFRELNGFRDVPYCPDYDFLLRCIGTNYKLEKMGTSVVKYRTRSTSGSRMNSLEQFLNSEGIRKLYKKEKLDNQDAVSSLIQKSKDTLNEKNKENFKKAGEVYEEAARHWRCNKKLLSVFYIISSCLVCRRYVNVYIKVVKNKVIFKLYS